VLEALLHPVEYGPRAVEGGPAFAHCIEYLLGSAHVEVCLLLAGKAGIRQVLGRGAGADGHEDLLALAPAQLFVAGLYGLLYVLRHPGLHDQLLGSLFGFVQLRLLIDIDVERLEEPFGNARPVDEIPEGLCRDCKPSRYGNADFYHLTQARTLAAHYGKIVLSNFLQPNDVLHQTNHPNETIFVCPPLAHYLI